MKNLNRPLHYLLYCGLVLSSLLFYQCKGPATAPPNPDSDGRLEGQTGAQIEGQAEGQIEGQIAAEKDIAEETSSASSVDPLDDLILPNWGSSAYWDESPAETCTYYVTEDVAGGTNAYEWELRSSLSQSKDGAALFFVESAAKLSADVSGCAFSRRNLVLKNAAKEGAIYSSRPPALDDKLLLQPYSFKLRAIAQSLGKETVIDWMDSGRLEVSIPSVEKIVFLEDSYDCTLVLLKRKQLNSAALNASELTDSIWVDRKYPNRIVRTSNGTRKMVLKSAFRQ